LWLALDWAHDKCQSSSLGRATMIDVQISKVAMTSASGNQRNGMAPLRV
jgi:hypothetical protein